MKPITIVGGGLAGLTLGIGLRQQGVPVTLWEAGRYPRHRVCGEFISGRGQESLARAGLLELIREAGAIQAHTVGFYTPGVASRVRELPQSALCLPRNKVDALLADKFRELGGELREAQRWNEAGNREGVVLASGRRVQPVVDGWRWFGLKVHARGVALQADLEMHVSPEGYVGLCRQPDGVVNACGLFRSKTAAHDGAKAWEERLRGAPGSALRARMDGASFVTESFCAVAGINLKPQRAELQDECRIGDALTMIPPMTGNGMSIAFESAELALEPLAAWSRGDAAWMSARQSVARRCDEHLAERLKWAGWLQRASLTPGVQQALALLVSCNQRLWQALFAKTR